MTGSEQTQWYMFGFYMPDMLRKAVSYTVASAPAGMTGSFFHAEIQIMFGTMWRVHSFGGKN